MVSCYDGRQEFTLAGGIPTDPRLRVFEKQKTPCFGCFQELFYSVYDVAQVWRTNPCWLTFSFNMERENNHFH